MTYHIIPAFTSDWLEKMKEEDDKRRRETPEALVLLHGIAGEYVISRGRLNTPGKVLQWVHHLSDKTWITPSHLRDVIDYAYRYNGVNPYAEHA